MGFPASYTLRDIASSVLGCLFFLPILLTPGYVAAWFTGIFGFRTLTPPWKVLISLPLSVALCPIATYWLGGPFFEQAGSWRPVFAMYTGCFLIWLSFLAGLWGHENLPQWLRGFRWVSRSGWAIAAAWFAIAIGSLVDLQVNNRLYLSVSDYDHVTRAAITDAITRGGVHPANPLYFLGALSPLRYHYFWFLLCSLLTQMGTTRAGELVTSQQAIISSVVWCGWSLMALVPLYLRFFQEWTGDRLRRASLIAIALFAVTGLDIIPTLLYLAAGFPLFPEMEWWNEQVTSWFGALLWVPHHVAALVACLMGFLLTWNAALSGAWRRRITGGLLAGAAFATAAGASIYVTFVFTIFLIVWTAVTLLKGWLRHTAVLVIAGAVSAVLVIPYLVSLSGPGAGGSFVKFEIRQFIPLNILVSAWHIGSAPATLLRLIALPLNYFLELGFFGVAASVFLAGLRQRKLSPNTVAALTMAAVSVAVCTFLKSGVISGNDLGWRGFLPAQFVMLLWGADLIMQRGERAQAEGKTFHSWWLRSPLWASLIILGAIGTTYEVVLLRSYFWWNDAVLTAHTGLAPDSLFGERALELRQVYETLDRALPPAAKLQANPEGHYFDFYSGLYSNRQTVVGDRACGTVFGGDSTKCPAAYDTIKAVFDGAPNETWEDVKAVCRGLSIDALIVTDFDRAWHGELSWGWQATPAISGNHVRVYLIGDPHR
jgi:hypothetical protein